MISTTIDIRLRHAHSYEGRTIPRGEWHTISREHYDALVSQGWRLETRETPRAETRTNAAARSITERTAPPVVTKAARKADETKRGEAKTDDAQTDTTE